jgi:hypothetical protein
LENAAAGACERSVAAKTRKTLLLIVLGVVVLGLVAWQASRALRPREYTLQNARLVKLDVAARTAEIEFVHPKSGRTQALNGRVPDDCPITINDQPATLEQLRPGDVAAVRGTVYSDRVVQAQWVKVTRSASQPARPATAPSTPSPAQSASAPADGGH